LVDLPEIELAEGYAIRSSHEGDGVSWARIVGEAFNDKRFDEARFERAMRRHPAYRPDRIFFACAPDGLPVATASAYRKESFGDETGYLHYVAVCPAHAGKRLGAAVSVAALYRFRCEGLRQAVLETDDFRLAAIKTYLRLGFRPLIVHENQPARWGAIFARLVLPAPRLYERAGENNSI
jgi:mycothiol synthase